MGRVLGSSSFGVVKFWGRRVLGSLSFGVVEFWGRQVLLDSAVSGYLVSFKK